MLEFFMEFFKDGKDMLTKASTTCTQAWGMRRCGTVPQCFHHASMEDATVTKTKADVTEATPICKGVKAEHMTLPSAY